MVCGVDDAPGAEVTPGDEIIPEDGGIWVVKDVDLELPGAVDLPMNGAEDGEGDVDLDIADELLVDVSEDNGRDGDAIGTVESPKPGAAELTEPAEEELKV